MAKDLKNIVIDMAQHAPIVKMNGAKDYQHFLKDVDHKNVKALFYYCLDNEFDLYVTGGVIASGMMTGQKQYTDIDMLAVADGAAVQNLAILLSRCHSNAFKYDISNNTFMPKTLKELSQEKGQYVFSANGQLFNTIGASTAERQYLNNFVDERFILMPLISASSVEAVHGRMERPSSIDLSVMDRKRFNLNSISSSYI